MQQVNLYQDQFKPKQIILPARQLFLLSLLAVIIFTLLSVYSAKRNSTLEAHISSQQQLGLVEQQPAVVDNQALLKANLLQLQQQQHQQQRLLDYLTHQSFGNQYGFADNLVHLSKKKIDGVWLTNFSFINGGQHISLHGSALQSSQIPLYIDGLAESGPFQGKHFSVFSLKSPEEADSDIYTFKLRTDQNSAGQIQ
ncbi:MAG: hypothetical protein COA83_05025 [Methylophaga sp.]|nr:MAG: hypothetical protein COA83_05025 [Methylophaga sp.]